MDKQNIGDRIKESRKKLNLTQEQLAEKLDITVTYVSEIERNLKLPSMSLFIKLVETLDVASDYLLRDVVSTRNLYGDNVLGRKLARLTPKQRVALEALIDTYIEYLD